MWRFFGMLSVVVALGTAVVGCATGTDEDEATAPPPVPNINFGVDQGPRAGTRTANNIATLQGQTREAQTLAVVTSTPLPTATINPEFIVTFTPEPSAVPVDDDDDFIGNSYSAQEWLQYNFTLTDGSSFTLNDFGGEVLVISLINPGCSECVEQVQTVREGALIYSQQLGNSDIEAIFLALNISGTIASESVGFLAERDGYAADDELSWLVGLASSPLRSSIEATFGEDLLNANNLPLIFLDQDGVAHLTNADVVDEFYIRDAIIFYNGGGGEEEG